MLTGQPIDFTRLRAEHGSWDRQLRELHDAVAAADSGEQLEVVRAAAQLLMQALDDLERAVRRTKVARLPDRHQVPETC
ncbi:hypothetical protein P3T37_007381 [Kitasatospora sp. MAA4]|uniref:hypothetical protein n=1 Tax=Kitasatospora sp. MAA4 TaxID=3035093 RepID=UPI002474D8E1|nr:hypothetical protein [Kitasatospora sp. MAA4]MDH6137943.1 hypothetical protein [Kitasatospora sp. MAA4]